MRRDAWLSLSHLPTHQVVDWCVFCETHLVKGLAVKDDILHIPTMLVTLSMPGMPTRQVGRLVQPSAASGSSSSVTFKSDPKKYLS